MNAGSNSRWQPWRCDGTALAPPLLLLAKLLALLLLRHHFPVELREPFLPFVPALDVLRNWPGVVTFVLRAVFIGAAVLLWCNVAVRLMSAALAGGITLAMLGSMPLFRNHLWIAGCLLWLVAWQRPGGRPWLLHAQFGLIYGGAALNKLLDADWRNGAFMQAWLGDFHKNPPFLLLDELLPSGLAAQGMAWSVIATEAVLAVALVWPRWQRCGVWLLLLFHWGMFLLLGGERFGHFFEDILIGTLCFAWWPAGAVEVLVSPGQLPVIRQLVVLLDWNRVVKLAPQPNTGSGSGDWLTFRADRRERMNLAGLCTLLRCLPGFYTGLLLLEFAVLRLLPWQTAFVVLAVVGSSLFALFLAGELIRGERANPPSMPSACR